MTDLTRRTGALEFRPRPTQFAWTFGGCQPVAAIRPGSVLELWTEDAFSGLVRSRSDKVSQLLPLGRANPQTGPFYVETAEPGDTLAIHIAALTPARTWGASACVPYFGGLTSTPGAPTLQPPLPERAWIYHLDSARRTLAFEAADGAFAVDLPLQPMLGTVGVAPAAGEVRTTMVPADYGGNMDTPELRAGRTCYLGVNVEGALFSIGDGHYRQGEGESCGSAVEGAMDAVLLVDVVKGVSTPWPRIEAADWLMSVGSARPLENAWRIANHDLVTWVAADYALDPLDAYQLLSQTVEAPIANVVDPNFSVVAKVRKRFLPPGDPYRGTHTRLAGRAAEVT